MKTVRRMIAKKTVELLFEEGDIFIQKFDDPDIFYPLNSENLLCGLDVKVIDKHGGIYKYFEELEPIPVRASKYYRMREKEINAEISKIDDCILSLNNKKKALLSFIEDISK